MYGHGKVGISRQKRRGGTGDFLLTLSPREYQTYAIRDVESFSMKHLPTYASISYGYFFRIYYIHEGGVHQ